MGKNFDDCFKVEFQPVLTASARTTELFQGVFDQHSALSPDLKNKFEALYDNHSNLADCFDDGSSIEADNGTKDEV